MSILSNLFGGRKDAAAAASPYLNQIPGVGHQYLDPFINQGQAASTALQGQYGSLMNDPTAFYNKLMEGFQPSDSYNFKKDQLTKSMGATAAAGGVAGTPLDQLQEAEGVNGLLSEDMQQFLKNVLGIYGTGLQGEQGIADTGFKASGGLADMLGGALNQQAGLAFQDAQQQNADKAGIWSMLSKFLGGATGLATGGGIGGLVSGGLGSSMFGGS